MTCGSLAQCQSCACPISLGPETAWPDPLSLWPAAAGMGPTMKEGGCFALPLVAIAEHQVNNLVIPKKFLYIQRRMISEMLQV